ncbi:MAG: histidine phosphatase family protein [Anaerolineae bacterium]|nr:histidine phosphatase family protein [Anaerolineae bacterium]
MKTTQKTITTFLLIRHATNDALQNGLLYGRTPGIHLNAAGRRQAQALAERLAALELAAIYTSPLERAAETAAPIAARLALDPIVCLDLAEGDAGEWTGSPIAEVSQTELWQDMIVHASGVPLPGGESMWHVQVRMVRAVEAMHAEWPGQTVVVVSHADAIRSLVAHYLGLPLDLFRRLTVAPASITTLRLGGQVPRLVCLNDTAHLPVLEAGG